MDEFLAEVHYSDAAGGRYSVVVSYGRTILATLNALSRPHAEQLRDDVVRKLTDIDRRWFTN